MSKCIGIDISKQTFDVGYLSGGDWQHARLANDPSGFTNLAERLEDGDVVIMEASGPYYLPLAGWLHAAGVAVVVENPLVIRRFSQARMYRAKTDKKDARTLAEYGARFAGDLRLWRPEDPVIADIRQLLTRIEMIGKQIHQNKRQREAFRSSGHVESVLSEGLEEDIARLQAHVESLAAAITNPL